METHLLFPILLTSSLETVVHIVAPTKSLPMKIAVIGGNLLGCATAVNLALTQESDARKLNPDAASNPPYKITVFERTLRLGGNSLRSFQVDNNLRIEIGTYRSLPLIPGTYLSDLVTTANDERGTLQFLGRRITRPDSTVKRRGHVNAVPVQSVWTSGTYNRVVRSFATLDWRDSTYHLMHSGWSILDLLHGLLKNAIWRSLALAVLLSTLQTLAETDGIFERSIALVRVVLAMLLVILGPQRVVAHFQRQYSFWATTLTMLWTYGITPGIARGGMVGFTKHLSDMKAKNAVAFSVTVGSLTHRLGLDAYLQGTGYDYVRIFRYNKDFVDHFMAPVIAIHNNGAKMHEVSSLAAHFAMLYGDPINSDACTRLAHLSPDNAALCDALLEAAGATADIDVRLDTTVQQVNIEADEEGRYAVTLSDGSEELFDGVVLCASVRDGDITLRNAHGMSVADVLGYTKDKETVRRFESQEAAYRVEHGEDDGSADGPVTKQACSHLAVVVGRLNASFFHFAKEDYVPDVVQVLYAPQVSCVERMRESTDEQDGVYVVTCGDSFTTDGSIDEMFESGADVRFYESVREHVYSSSALPEESSVDECTPAILLAPRFVHAAALECLAKHPEVDAFAAANAASLFSSSVRWAQRRRGEEEDGGGDAGEVDSSEVDGFGSDVSDIRDGDPGDREEDNADEEARSGNET